MDMIIKEEYIYFIDIEWRPIIVDGIFTNYEVSNIGQVRNRKTGRILSTYTDNDGYIHSSIMISKRQYHPGIHRFVATAFIPNPENKPEVNHINGVKNDNVVVNLEWATTSENIKHAFATGLKYSKLGESNSLSVYSEKQIKKVCKLLEKGMSNKTISEKTGVDRKYITDIKKGRRWKHISSHYNIKKYKYPPEMKTRIQCMVENGSSNKDIIHTLALDDNPSTNSLINRIRCIYRLKGSTTIP